MTTVAYCCSPIMGAIRGMCVRHRRAHAVRAVRDSRGHLHGARWRPVLHLFDSSFAERGGRWAILISMTSYFGYGGNTFVLTAFPRLSRKGADQLHRWTERVRKINARETRHGAYKARFGACLFRARRRVVGSARSSAAFGRARAAARGAHDDGARAGGVRKISASRAAISARTRPMGTIDEALSLAGVYDLRDRPLRSLSGGQRQRARMAMVLAQDTPSCCSTSPHRSWMRRRVSI